MSRFACVWVEHFVAAVHERCEPELRELPLAVVRGTPPASQVVEANDTARAQGVTPGLTQAEASARCPTLVTRPASEERSTSAREALLEATLGMSPRVEDGGPGVVYLDLAGLHRLFGDDTAIARRLIRAVRGVGLLARIGIAGSRVAARIAARQETRVTVIPPGEDRATLRSMPLRALELELPLAETFASWGISTLGELADLPRDGLAMRLGPEGLRAQDEALGRDREPFRPYTPPPFWEEAQGVEWEIVSWDRLQPVLAIVLERLCARLTAAHVCGDVLELLLGLAAGGHDVRTISLAYPLRQARPMLALIDLEIEARPLSGPVTRIAVSARAVRAEPGQAGLWHPPSPALRDLAGTLARLVVLVGRSHVGSPALDDSHRPDAFTMAAFAPPSSGDALPPPLLDGESFPLAFRRLRPPRPLVVETDGDEPSRLRFRGDVPTTSRTIAVCVGPWQTSGEWWDERAWARDEWDVVLDDGALYRLVHDRITGGWFLDGAYD